MRVDRHGFASPFDESVAFVVVHEGDHSLPALLPEEAALISPRAAVRYATDVRLGRAAARLAMRQLGIPDMPIVRGAHREPVWPEGIVGAITHAGGYALAAVAPAARFGGLGIDLERRTDMRDITSHIALPEEQEWLRTLPPAERQRHVLQLFSAKESVYKAFFPRVREYFGFDRALLRWDVDSAAFSGELRPPLDEVPGANGFRVHCQWQGEYVLTAMSLEGSPHPP